MCKTHTDLERERFFVHFLLDQSGLEVGTKLLCAEVRPTFSATNSIDTYIKTDPTLRICIPHNEYSELTVHKGNAQLFRFIIEIAITRWSVNECYGLWKT
jgi:hypothetical protein